MFVHAALSLVEASHLSASLQSWMQEDLWGGGGRGAQVVARQGGCAASVHPSLPFSLVGVNASRRTNVSVLCANASHGEQKGNYHCRALGFCCPRLLIKKNSSKEHKIRD